MTSAATSIRGRAPVGATPSVRDHLGARRTRPILVRLWVAVLGDSGIAGAPARRICLVWLAVPQQ